MNPYKQLDIKTIKELLRFTITDGPQDPDSVFARLFLPISMLQAELNGHLIANLSYYIKEYNVEERQFNDVNAGIFMLDRPPLEAISTHILTQELKIKQIELIAIIYKLI